MYTILTRIVDVLVPLLVIYWWSAFQHKWTIFLCILSQNIYIANKMFLLRIQFDKNKKTSIYTWYDFKIKFHLKNVGSFSFSYILLQKFVDFCWKIQIKIFVYLLRKRFSSKYYTISTIRIRNFFLTLQSIRSSFNIYFQL
jgi:hypothetical protein